MAAGRARLTVPPTAAQLEEAKRQGIPTAKAQGALNPAQLEFLGLSNEVQLFLGGFGAGKTFVGAFKTILHMLTSPGSTSLAIAPSYALTKNQFKAVLALCERMRAVDGVSVIASQKISAGQGEIRLTNGSLLLFRSAASRVGLFGLNVSWVWIDELELCEDPAGTYQDAHSRLREQSDGVSVTVARLCMILTSTAHSLSGLLADLIERAQREHADYRAALDRGESPDPPRIGLVTAPSTRAIGYGLERRVIDSWAREMDPDEFLRGVMCRLMPPAEVIFADRVSGDTYPFGNVIDYEWDPKAPTYALVDWGTFRPHVLFAQRLEKERALVIVEEWGPDGSSVQDTIHEIRRVMHAQGRATDTGARTRPKAFLVIGDPTTNPGAGRGPESEHNAVALDGRLSLRAMDWPYVAPERHEQRSKQRQIQFVRAMLRPKSGPPRILFARGLTAKTFDQKCKRTRRGIWQALTDGYCYEKSAQGVVKDRPKKDGVWDHAVDALAYGAVVIFAEEFWRLYATESGLYTGAQGW